MKFIKNIFLFLLVLFLVGAIYLATLEGNYDVKRSIIIKAKPEVIFNDLNDYKNWKEWGPWYEKDSTIQVIYGENTVGVGGSYSWTSEQEGDGFLETLQVEKPKSLKQEIKFITPFGDMKSDMNWNLEEIEEGTKVTWIIKGEISFFYRFMVKGMVEEVGFMEERGLELLAKHIQNKIKVYHIENEGVVDYSGGFYLYTTTSSKISEMGTKFPVMLAKVGDFVSSNHIRTSGSSFTIYHKFDQQNGTTMFSVCTPIPERMITPKGTDILTGFMKRGKYVKTTLQGSYENSKMAWDKAMIGVEELIDYTMLENGEPFEVYVNNILTTPNPADLITEIYIPVVKVNALDE